MRDLSSLFTEEAVKEEQSQIFHLITIEMFDGSTFGTTAADTSVVSVLTAKDLSIGRPIALSNETQAATHHTITGIDGSSITISPAAATAFATYKVSYVAVLQLVDNNYDVTYDGITYSAFPIKFGEMSMSSDGSIDKASLSVANVSREITYYVEMYNGLSNRQVSVKTVFANVLDNIYYVKRNVGTYKAGEFYLKGDTVEYNGTYYTCVQEGANPVVAPHFIVASGEEESVSYAPNPSKDTTSYLEDTFVIDSYSYDETMCTFSLDPSISFDVKLPRRKFYDNSCQWIYRDEHTCKFAGDDPDGQVGCSKTLAACKARGNEARYGGFPGINGNRRVWF